MTTDPFSDEAEFFDATFEGIEARHLRIDRKVFKGCTFIGVQFAGATFASCRFIDCTFRRCDLSNASVKSCTWKNATFEDSKLLEPGRFAVFQHKGPPGTMMNTVREIQIKWAPRIEGLFKTNWELMVYPSGYNPTDPNATFDYWLPLPSKNG